MLISMPLNKVYTAFNLLDNFAKNLLNVRSAYAQFGRKSTNNRWISVKQIENTVDEAYKHYSPQELSAMNTVDRQTPADNLKQAVQVIKNSVITDHKTKGMLSFLGKRQPMSKLATVIENTLNGVAATDHTNVRWFSS